MVADFYLRTSHPHITGSATEYITSVIFSTDCIAIVQSLRVDHNSTAACKKGAFSGLGETINSTPLLIAYL